VDPRLAWLEALQHKLQQRREEHLLRELHPVASPQGAQLVIEGRTFVHRNTDRARALLERDVQGLKFLVTDSIFSMDGDVADLPALADIAEENGAMLVIDEAHATGVLGERGAGLAELQGVEERVAITVGTLSKSLGSIGGFVAGPRDAIDTLINEGRSFIYTTALPPACSAAALASLKIIQREPQRRQRVMRLSRHVKSELSAMGYDTGDSASPIIPVILGDPAHALAAADKLKHRNLYIPAIRPPTVPPNSARLRISLMATHTDAHIEQLLSAMRVLRAEFTQ
jgi:7-keto-8-aminopelargonate synthetase-like enzyme